MSPSSSDLPQTPYSFPNGHIGHLTPQQKDTLTQFKALCIERGAYQAQTSSGLPSTDDATLLRFLRARKFELEPAYKQFIDTEKWRRDNEIEELYRAIDIEQYEITKRLYPQWTGRRDKRGMPLYVFEVAPLSSKAVQEYEKAQSIGSVFHTVIHHLVETQLTKITLSTKYVQFTISRLHHTLGSLHPLYRQCSGVDASSLPSSPKLLLLFALYENFCRYVNPWLTAMTDRPHNTTPITQQNNIVDISGVGLKQFWDLKAHLQDSSKLATDHYPETLENIFVIGAPSFFPTVWTWVKNWFDPVVFSKMHILSPAEVFPTLSKYIKPQNIPKKSGGTHNWEYGDMPLLDEELLKGIRWTGEEGKLPEGPILWEDGEGGRMEMVAVGSEGGVRRRLVVGSLERGWRDVFYPRAE